MGMSGAKILLHDGGRRTFNRHKNDISLARPCTVQPAWATKQQPLLRSAYGVLNRGDTREGSRLRVQVCANGCGRCRARAKQFTHHIKQTGTLPPAYMTGAHQPGEPCSQLLEPQQPGPCSHQSEADDLHVLYSRNRFQRRQTYGDGWYRPPQGPGENSFRCCPGASHEKRRAEAATTRLMSSWDSDRLQANSRRPAGFYTHRDTSTRQPHNPHPPARPMTHRSSRHLPN